MHNLALILQIFLGILISISILTQQTGGGFFSGGSSAQSFHTKQGVEKLLFRVTIVAATLFAINGVGLLLW